MKFLIPQFALDFLKKEEGKRLQAYQDSKGQWTIGYGISFYPCNCVINGRQVKAQEPVKEGDKIDDVKAEELLFQYLKKYCWQDVEDIATALKTELNNYQIASILSVSYNVCNPKFKNSKCKQFIMKNDIENACKQWDWGIKDKNNPGLKKRRNKEIQFFYGFVDYWK